MSGFLFALVFRLQSTTQCAVLRKYNTSLLRLLFLLLKVWKILDSSFYFS